MLEKMSEMLAEQLNCEASTITPETSFKDDLGADSLDLFELVMANRVPQEQRCRSIRSAEGKCRNKDPLEQ